MTHDHRPFTLSSTCRTCIRIRAESVVPAIPPHSQESRMSDERLVEIERKHSVEEAATDYFRCRSCRDTWPCAPMQLLAEVRRLKRALESSEVARGVLTYV